MVDVRWHLRSCLLGSHQPGVVPVQQGPPPVAGQSGTPAAAVRSQPAVRTHRQAQNQWHDIEHGPQCALYDQQRDGTELGDGTGAGESDRRTTVLPVPVPRDPHPLWAARPVWVGAQRRGVHLSGRDPNLRLQLAAVLQLQ
uniref:(northern house mosquito) hypothetical protein n=1 Tax=Culex pipiens TaxID=7175 RepID=A0A8D8KHP1_CULPI